MKPLKNLIIISTLLLFIGVGCNLQKNNIQNAKDNLTVDSKKTTTTEKIEEKKIVKNENIQNCKNDLSCMIEASKTCQLSKVNTTYTLNMMGVNLTFDDYYEIKGMVGEKCLFYLKTNDLNIKYSDSMKQLLIEQGMSEIEISDYEKIGKIEAQQSYNGKDAICFFDKTDSLTNLLNNWLANDRITIGITDVASCSGELINSSIEGESSTKLDISN